MNIFRRKKAIPCSFGAGFFERGLKFGDFCVGLLQQREASLNDRRHIPVVACGDGLGGEALQFRGKGEVIHEEIVRQGQGFRGR